MICPIYIPKLCCELHEYAFDGLRLYFLGFLIVGINVMLITFFAATNRPGADADRIAAAWCDCNFYLCSSSGCAVWHDGYLGVSLLASEIVTLAVLMILYRRQKKTI